MSRKIVEYKIISERYNFNLDKEVQSKIMDGYQPFGQPFFDFDTSICQTIVKYEDETKDNS